MTNMLRCGNPEFTGKGVSSWTVTSPAQIAYSMNSFTHSSTKFDQSLGGIETSMVDNWTNWLYGTTLSVENMARTFALWDTKTFTGTPTIDFGNAKYDFRGWVSKDKIYNETGVTLGGTLIGANSSNNIGDIYQYPSGDTTASPSNIWTVTNWALGSDGLIVVGNFTAPYLRMTKIDRNGNNIDTPPGTTLTTTDRVAGTSSGFTGSGQSGSSPTINNGQDLINYWENGGNAGHWSVYGNSGYLVFQKSANFYEATASNPLDDVLVNGSPYPTWGLFAIPNCPNRTQLRSSFNNYTSNPDRVLNYNYSPILTQNYAGGTFDGSGTELGLDMNWHQLMGDSDRTFIATIKTTHTGSQSTQSIFGYGSTGHNGECFALQLTNKSESSDGHVFGGNDDDEYILTLKASGSFNPGAANGGFSFASKLKVYANVETTVGVSFGTWKQSSMYGDRGQGWIHIFKRDPLTGICEMESQKSNLYTMPGSHHERYADRGLAIGCMPFLGGGTTTYEPFHGTIHNLSISNYMIYTTQQFCSPGCTLNWNTIRSNSSDWLSKQGDTLWGKPEREHFGSPDTTNTGSSTAFPPVNRCINGKAYYYTWIVLILTDSHNETLKQFMKIKVCAPEDYEDWDWMKNEWYSVATRYLDADYHYFESERAEAVSGNPKGTLVLNTSQLNNIIQNTSNRFKYGTIAAIMYNVDITTFYSFSGTNTHSDYGRILWYIGTTASNRNDNDNDNMHLSFVRKLANNNGGREWMKPKFFYEQDQAGMDIRIAREDQEYSQGYDWLYTFSWHPDTDNLPKHVHSCAIRQHNPNGLIGRITKRDYTFVNMAGKSYISMPLIKGQDFSIEFFVNMRSIATTAQSGSGSNYYGLVRLYKNNDFLLWFEYDVNYQGAAGWKVQKPTPPYAWYGNTAVTTSAGTWNHIVITCDKTNSKIRYFINGTERLADTDYSYVASYDWTELQLDAHRRGGDRDSSNSNFAYLYKFHDHILTPSFITSRQKTQTQINDMANESGWRRWAGTWWRGLNGGHNWRSDTGVPFWEDQVATSHAGLHIGGNHRTNKDGSQFPYDCRVLVLKDSIYGRSDTLWRGGDEGWQVRADFAVNPKMG
tara:strand:- start:14389 stop:17691 length:3303 start_codon:yes stop_codon:yes gene_type:complete